MRRGGGVDGEEKGVQITAIGKVRTQQRERTYKENGEGSVREAGGRLWGPSTQGLDWGRLSSRTGAVGNEMR